MEGLNDAGLRVPGFDEQMGVPVSGLPFAAFVFSGDRLRGVNSAALQLLRQGPGARLEDIHAILDPHDRLGEAMRRSPSSSIPQLRVEAVLPDRSRLPLELHLLKLAGGHMLVMAHDNSAHRDVEQQLQRRLLFERLLTEASAALMRSGADELDGVIVDMLGSIGSFFGVDRSYVFLIDDAAQTQSNTHEWVAPGISREAHNLQDLPLTTFPWLLAQLRADHVFRVESVANLPDEAISERTEFEREGIQSILIVPLRVGSRLHGFVGFDAVRSQVQWGEQYVIGLRLMAQMLASSLEARTLSRRLHEQAFHDALTGLPNRKLLEDRYAQLSRRLQRVGGTVMVALVDLDDFKQVNDRYGHAAGDCLLRCAAARLGAVMRDADTLARLGGDEFVVLAEETSVGATTELARRLLGAVEAPFVCEGNPLSIGISIGLVRETSPDQDLGKLLRTADVAMYKAKAKGKNNWVEATRVPPLPAQSLPSHSVLDEPPVES
ncbi:diguanylate cyclase domain-containing protein [Lysobacter fragariae]